MMWNTGMYAPNPGAFKRQFQDTVWRRNKVNWEQVERREGWRNKEREGKYEEELEGEEGDLKSKFKKLINNMYFDHTTYPSSQIQFHLLTIQLRVFLLSS